MENGSNDGAGAGARDQQASPAQNRGVDHEHRAEPARALTPIMNSDGQLLGQIINARA
jgi:hypothetical protein